MNLVFFLTIGILGLTVLGEFGKYPFGAVGNSVSILDIFVAITAGVFLIWKLGVTKKIDPPRLYRYIAGFTLIGGLSLIFNMNFSGSLYLVRFILYSLFFWIGSSLVKEKLNWGESIQEMLIKIGVISSVLGFLQLVFFPNLTFLSSYGYDPHINRLAGTFFDPNFLGAFLCLIYGVSVIQFLKTKSNKNLAILIILIIAIILTFSRSTWLMFGIINIFTFRYLQKKIITILICILLVSVVFIPRVQQRLLGAVNLDISASERFNSWDKGRELFEVNPLIGIGFNNIRDLSIKKDLLKPFTADGGNSGGGVDSSWLLIFATTGILGGGMFIYFYFSLMQNFVKAFYQTKSKEFLIMVGIMTAFFVNSQFINSLFYPPLMLVFFLLMGVYYAQVKKS